MASPDDFINSNTDEAGRFRWPADERQREELAQTLFGLTFIESLDGVVGAAEDWLTNAAPSRPLGSSEELARIDREYRAVFQTLTAEQRAAVSRLLRHSVRGALFATLAGIDQFSYGRFEIRFVGEGDTAGVPLAPGWQCLHERFFEWRRHFSAYPTDEGGPVET